MGSGRSGLYHGATPETSIQPVYESKPSKTFIISDLDTEPNSGNAFDDYQTDINPDKQSKHIPGSKNFQPGKSELTIPVSHAQELINRFHNKGTKISDNKERVDFGEVIGKYVDPVSGEKTETTIGIIHYSKTGTHIVPARPRGEE